MVNCHLQQLQLGKCVAHDLTEANCKAKSGHLDCCEGILLFLNRLTSDHKIYIIYIFQEYEVG